MVDPTVLENKLRVTPESSRCSSFDQNLDSPEVIAVTYPAGDLGEQDLGIQDDEGSGIQGLSDDESDGEERGMLMFSPL